MRVFHNPTANPYFSPLKYPRAYELNHASLFPTLSILVRTGNILGLPLDTNVGCMSIEAYLTFIKYNLFSKYLRVLHACIGAPASVSSASAIGSPVPPKSTITTVSN